MAILLIQRIEYSIPIMLMTPNALNYHHLLYFWAVATEGSLRRAGELLHVSQPSISAQLKQLEESLGAPLFTRTSRRLILTDTGQKVLARVCRRNLFLGPRAFDRGSSGAGATSSSFARRCCRLGAENNRAPAP
jgi:hypothetical protein